MGYPHQLADLFCGRLALAGYAVTADFDCDTWCDLHRSINGDPLLFPPQNSDIENPSAFGVLVSYRGRLVATNFVQRLNLDSDGHALTSFIRRPNGPGATETNATLDSAMFAISGPVAYQGGLAVSKQSRAHGLALLVSWIARLWAVARWPEITAMLTFAFEGPRADRLSNSWGYATAVPLCRSLPVGADVISLFAAKQTADDVRNSARLALAQIRAKPEVDANNRYPFRAIAQAVSSRKGQHAKRGVARAA